VIDHCRFVPAAVAAAVKLTCRYLGICPALAHVVVVVVVVVGVVVVGSSGSSGSSRPSRP
jgi:hypothetical protein